jgi:glyoxylase I family protein
MLEVIGFDHVYVTVSNVERSEKFYDAVMTVLGFRKNQFLIDGEKHIQYFNRYFGYVLRPARQGVAHNPYAPGLHHLCFRVENEDDVNEAVVKLKAANIQVTDAKLHSEYAPDYFATFFSDPDGIRLEITNYRLERRQRHDNWEHVQS